MSSNLLLEPYRTVMPPSLTELRKKKPKEKKKKKGLMTGRQQKQSGINLIRESNRTNLLMSNEFMP